MTELSECVRTEDPWLLEVQEEMRSGSLLEESWKFLHGMPTKVPGSWVNGGCGCGNVHVGDLVRRERDGKVCSGQRERVMVGCL